MKTILVPVDFSKEADAALEVALSLANKMGSKIQLLHIIESIYYNNLSNKATYFPEEDPEKTFIQEQKDAAEKQLKKKKQAFASFDVRIGFSIKVGSVIKHILEMSQEEKVDFIMMGTKGASGLEEMLIGSNTEKIVRLAKCPVLTVKEKPANFDLRNVVVAVNFEDDSKESMVNLQKLQQIFGFTIHVLHVNTPLNFDTTFKIERKMEAFKKKYQLQTFTFTIINEYAFEDGILKFADKINADLIVTFTHGRRGFTRLMDGSVTEGVVNHAVKPILTYHLE